MAEVGRTGPKQAASASTALSPDAAKQINELKETIKKIKALIKEPNSLLWQVYNIPKFTLNDGNCNDIISSAGRAGGPTAKEKRDLKDLRRTSLALDKALGLLGYKRDLFIHLGIPEAEQADFDWVSKRMAQFQKDRGLMNKWDRQIRAIIGKKTIDVLLKALNEKAINLASK